MYAWIETMSRYIAIALVLCLASPLVGEAANRQVQEGRYQQISERLQQLRQQQQAQAKAVQEAAQELELLKRQARRGGLFGLPAKVRLPKARAMAQQLSGKLAQINQQISQLSQRQQRLRQRLRHNIRVRLGLVRRSLQSSGLTAARRRQLQGEAQRLLQRHQALSSNPSSVRPGNLPQLRIAMDPLDGPAELRQKADRIKDAEDNVARILRKLHGKLDKIKKKARRQSNENKLETWVDNTSDLFPESSRNPRVVTGKSTSERLRPKGGSTDSYEAAPSLQGQTTRTPPLANSGTQSPPVQSGNPSPAPPPTTPTKGNAPPGSADNPNTANKGGGTTNPSESPSRGTNGFQNDSSSPDPQPQGTTHLQPRLGSNTTLQPGLGQEGKMPAPSYTLNPKGTLKQQLEALKRYQQHLKRYRQHLRQHHQHFLKRAKQLRRERRRR